MKTNTVRSMAVALLLAAIVSLSFSVRSGSAEEAEEAKATPVTDSSAQSNAYKSAYSQSHQAAVDQANTAAAQAGDTGKEEDSGSCA